MKAIIPTRYGPPDVLELVEFEKPIPKDGEVLVKIHAASLNALDWHLATADIFLVRLMGGGLLKPKNTAVGADIAGWVEAVGKGVQLFKPADEVFGYITPSWSRRAHWRQITLSTIQKRISPRMGGCMTRSWGSMDIARFPHISAPWRPGANTSW